MKNKWIFWMISLFLTLLCMKLNNTYYAMHKMIPLEFSPSPDSMHKYIMAVGCSPECCYHVLKMNTIVDYGFLISYSFLTFFSFCIFLDVFQIPMKAWVYILSFITGILDAVENYFLFQTGNNQKEFFSSLYYWVVRIKWVFALIPIILIPIVIFYSLIVLFRAKQNN